MMYNARPAIYYVRPGIGFFKIVIWEKTNE